MRVLLDEHLRHRLRQLFAVPIEREHFMKHRDSLLWTFPRAATVALLLLFWTINTLPAQTTFSAEDIAEKALAATVYLEMQDKNGKTLGFGSGFFVKFNLIATNYHVIEGAAKGTAKLIGKYTTYDVEGVTATDKVNDLALLKVTTYGIKPLPLGDSGTVRIGETVYVAGNPKGLEGTFSDGIISSRRDKSGKERLQMTAPISPGSSGGPVLNRKGEVIGVSFAGHQALDAQNLNFAIPSKYLKALLARSKPAKTLLQGNDPSISAKTYISWGNAKYHLRDYAGALADYTMAIRLKLDFAKAYNNRGLAKDNLEQYVAAISDYDTAIRLKPNFVEAYFNRGNAKYHLRDYAGALVDYTMAIRLKPNFAKAYGNRGNAKDNLGQYTAAISDYDTAIRLKPDDADAYNNRGVTKRRLGQYFAAIADYDTAIRLKSDFAMAYYNRGLAKDRLKRYAAAISDYNIAIRLKSDYVEAYYNRGLAKILLRRTTEAKQDFQKALRLAEKASNTRLKSDIESMLQKIR